MSPSKKKKKFVDDGVKNDGLVSRGIHHALRRAYDMGQKAADARKGDSSRSQGGRKTSSN